jgi:hypothetical protein
VAQVVGQALQLVLETTKVDILQAIHSKDEVLVTGSVNMVQSTQ